MHTYSVCGVILLIIIQLYLKTQEKMNQINSHTSAHSKQERSFLRSEQTPSVASFALTSNTHNFTVAARIKPKSPLQENSKIVIHKNKEELHIQSTKAIKSTYAGSKSKNFKMNSIFDQTATNSEIFNHLIRDKLSLLKQNCNIAVMAYGATNSGKTFTIFGDQRKSSSQQMISSKRGLAYQCAAFLINDLFRQKFKFYLSYVEIYNENIQDLLAERSIKKNYLNIFEDHLGKINIPDLTKIEVENYLHFCSLIQKGNELRAEASNQVNSLSSRSHAILQLDVFSVEDADNLETYVPIDVNFMLIDLAGSEKSTPYLHESNQILLKEGANINKSLLALGNCIKNLANGDTHIPYRDSKLTRLLKQNLSGCCQNIMIACISQQMSQYQQTINTLQYAAKACKIQSFDSKNIKERTSYLKIPCQHCHMTMNFDYFNNFIKHHGFQLVDKFKIHLNNKAKFDCKDSQTDRESSFIMDISRTQDGFKQLRKGRSVSYKSGKDLQREKTKKEKKQIQNLQLVLGNFEQKKQRKSLEKCKLRMVKKEKQYKVNQQSEDQPEPYMPSKNINYIKQELQSEEKQLKGDWKKYNIPPLFQELQSNKQNIPRCINIKLNLMDHLQKQTKEETLKIQEVDVKQYSSVGVKRMKPDSFQQVVSEFQSQKAVESRPRIKIIPKLRN